jgi:hypothetical protein
MKVKALVVLIILAASSTVAQQPEAAKDTNQAVAKVEKPVRRPYRFEYSLTEVSGKQKINTRKFDFLTSNRGEVHAGSKVAVPTNSFSTGKGSNTQFQYFDTGFTAEMNWDPRADGEIDLHIQVNMIFLVNNPETAVPDSNLPASPVRTINMQIDTRVKPGVPTVLGSVEDVASTHSYELSVTANPR